MVFRCPIGGCGSELPTQAALDAHMRKPHYPCEVCGRKFTHRGRKQHQAKMKGTCKRQSWLVRTCTIHQLIPVDDGDLTHCPTPATEGDGPCGRLLSEPFTVSRDRIPN